MSIASVVTAGPQYAYTYDAMNRISGMTDQNNQTLVSSVSYSPANQVLQLNAAGFTETRTYNANLQLIELGSGAYHYKYNYSATQNNGRIQSQTDVASGETITHQYCGADIAPVKATDLFRCFCRRALLRQTPGLQGAY